MMIEYYDVTINGIKANKCILASHEYFKSLFKHNDNDITTTFSTNGINEIIKYCYSGEIETDLIYDIVDIYNISHEMDMKKLFKSTEIKLKKAIKENVFDPRCLIHSKIIHLTDFTEFVHGFKKNDILYYQNEWSSFILKYYDIIDLNPYDMIMDIELTPKLIHEYWLILIKYYSFRHLILHSGIEIFLGKPSPLKRRLFYSPFKHISNNKFYIKCPIKTGGTIYSNEKRGEILEIKLNGKIINSYYGDLAVEIKSTIGIWYTSYFMLDINDSI